MAVFFLTGRPERFREATESNLRSAGYVAVNMGDQMSDLDGGFGERTYKLPNPFYFVP